MENKIKKAFEPIKADESMKADVKHFLNQSIKGNDSQKRNPFYMKKQFSALAVAICLAIVFVGAFQLQTIYAQAAYVELTGPTQLGISLNKNNKVIKLVGLDESGELIAESVDVNHLSYEDALDVILNCDAYQNHADTKIQVDVAVDCSNEECAKAIEQETEETFPTEHEGQGSGNGLQNQDSGNGKHYQHGHSK